MIGPEQIGAHKVALHRRALDAWREQRAPDRSSDELWAAREACIAALAEDGS